MSFNNPNYYNDNDRRLYDTLWQQPDEALTDSERDFVRTMYEQEEYYSYREFLDERHEDYDEEREEQEEESYSG